MNIISLEKEEAPPSQPVEIRSDSPTAVQDGGGAKPPAEPAKEAQSTDTKEAPKEDAEEEHDELIMVVTKDTIDEESCCG